MNPSANLPPLDLHPHWSQSALLQRYNKYAAEAGTPPCDPSADYQRFETSHAHPVIQKIIQAIERHDLAAIRIGIELLHENAGLRFGRLLKANTARALRRAARAHQLTSDQHDQLRTRFLSMLYDHQVPREYREYAKLLRTLGLLPADFLQLSRLTSEDPRVRRYKEYFRTFAPVANLH